MKAIRIHEHGNKDVLCVDDIEVPLCSDDKILVNIKASSLNHLDIWVRQGLPGIPIPLPLIMGSDGAGVITDIGKNVNGFSINDHVVIQPGTFKKSCNAVKKGNENYSHTYGILGETTNGTQSEYILVNKENIAPKAKHLSFEEASSMQLVFMTSYQMLVERAKLESTETVLIYGATSGIGSAAIQIAKDIGAKVITTVGSESKENYAHDMGANHVFIHDNQLMNNVKQVVGRKGVNVIFEHIGLKTWNQSLRMLSRGGRIVTCGSTTGSVVDIDLRYLFMKQQTILGSTMSNITSFNSVLSKIKDKKYKPFLDKVFSFKDIKDAHLRLENRQQYGKIVVVPN